ncbi:iron chelate uptake ABC transporter family permease subunit [Nanchangia anserum]|uniref:Iron chelate uptake ABC transporter family permease subunit n=1 Tax=Nanchangia anserum TaxID=2692125 RepID=A0A8I0KP61_9ACTO|nr:iron chelate uptake ABC transporter family permease subunit [Nanchangia anserum]QOX82561.1 iron chelate uptake ABC transporter family permease subunit [Nanchangia anserum]
MLRQRRREVRRGLVVTGILAVACIGAFALWAPPAAWQIIAPLRIPRLIGLVVVSFALPTATVVFQQVTRNRILSPSVMGFDAMYSLVATGLVFVAGSAAVNRIPSLGLFLLQAGVQTLLALGLFALVLTRTRASIHLLVLVGIVIGTMLRSFTAMLALVMDPNEYLSVQDHTMASFTVIDSRSLVVTCVVTLASLAIIWWRAPVWDVLALGPDLAISLGLNYRRECRGALVISSVLVACATALVGPLMFFGLLVVNIAVFALSSTRLRTLLLGSCLIGVIVLVGGQALLEHAFSHATVLPVILELVGGIVLLTMIVKESRR